MNGYPAIALAAVLATGSRTGSAAAGFATLGSIIIEIAWAKRRFYIIVGVLVAVAVAAVAITYIPTSGLSRITEFWTSVHSMQRAAISARAGIWREGLQQFAQAPWFGTGPGTFRDVVSSSQSPHNAYIGILVEGGVVGLTVFLTILSLLRAR